MLLAGRTGEPPAPTRPPPSTSPAERASAPPPEARREPPTADTSAPPAPEDADAPSAACRALAARNAEVLDAVDGGACKPEAPGLGCATTTAGVTWGWELGSARTRDENGPEKGEWSEMNCTTEASVRLLRVDAKGGKTYGPEETIVLAWDRSSALAVRALADYDGDGEVEVLRERAGKEHEGGPIEERTILTLARGKIAPYAPARGFSIVAVEDADGDGRPDLVTRGPYEGIVDPDAFGNAWPAGPAIFLAHAQPDGTFAFGDAASVTFTRGKCPARPALAFEPLDLQAAEGAETKVVCARLWGASEEDVVRAWNAACAAKDACEPWAKELAAVRPPFTLR